MDIYDLICGIRLKNPREVVYRWNLINEYDSYFQLICLRLFSLLWQKIHDKSNLGRNDVRNEERGRRRRKEGKKEKRKGGRKRGKVSFSSSCMEIMEAEVWSHSSYCIHIVREHREVSADIQVTFLFNSRILPIKWCHLQL